MTTKSKRENIFVCADVHIGNHKQFGVAPIHWRHYPDWSEFNSRAAMTLEVFRSFLLLAAQKGRYAFVCGDLFDKDQPGTALLKETIFTVRAVLDEFKDLELVLLNGNHDQTSKRLSAIDAVGFLSSCHCVVGAYTLANMPHFAPRVLCVPYQIDGAQSTMKVISEYVENSIRGQEIQVILLHAGLYDDSFSPWEKSASHALSVPDLAMMLSGSNVHTVVAGDWHHARTWDVGGVHFIQCGALCPTGFDDDGDTMGRVYEFDPSWNLVQVHTIAGPRFRTVSYEGSGQIEELLRTYIVERTTGMHRFTRVLTRPSEYVEAQKQVQQLQAQHCVTVEIDKRAAESRREAVRAAVTGRKSLADALAAHVAATEFPRHVSSNDVHDLCRKFLRL